MIDIHDINKIDFIKNVSNDIIDNLKCLNNKNIDFQFDIIRGNIAQEKDANEEGNTKIFFDITNKYKYLYDLKKIINDECYVNEQDTKIILFTIQAIAEYLISNCINELRNNIRRLVMKDSDVELFPLKNITIRCIDIIDVSDLSIEDTHLLRVDKLPYSNTKGENINYPIAQELLDEYKSNKENNIITDMDDIIANKKEQNILKYKNVLGCNWIKYLYECNISLDVDYSPIPQKEYEDILIQRKNIKKA